MMKFNGFTSITSTLSEIDVQLVEVNPGVVDITESGDNTSLDAVASLMTSIDSEVFWECCNVIMDGDGDC